MYGVKRGHDMKADRANLPNAGFRGLRHCLCCADMVHRQGWPCVCCGLPACADIGGCYHGFRSTWGTVLLGRVDSCSHLSASFHFSLFIMPSTTHRHTQSHSQIKLVLWLKKHVNSNLCFLRLNRIIGAVFIIIGLYLVLWGKNEERKFMAKDAAVEPLLPASTSENVWGRRTKTGHWWDVTMNQIIIVLDQ